MKKFIKDFKEFIYKRGNILDLAIAVIIGGAFGAIVTSLVNDIIMPIFTLAMGGQSVEDLKWVITPGQIDASGVVLVAENALRWGLFLQRVIDFLIIALCIFMMLRIVMKVKDGYEKLRKDIKKSTSKERKQKTAELKAQGMTTKQIKQEFTRLHAEALEKAKADAEAKKKEAEANRPPTTEELLTQIRDLLAVSAPQSPQAPPAKSEDATI